MNRNILVILLILLPVLKAVSQSAPAEDENIPYLMTFGGDSETSWGDDDFIQVFFCLIPPAKTDPVYIRIYDPDTGGELDEIKGSFNSVINFSVYGGNECWSDTTAQSIHPDIKHISGYQLSSRSFGTDLKYDKKWFTFGPFNPFEGEYNEKLGGRIIKIVAYGVSGDDGNIYKYFLSTSASDNIPVEGGNLFTYKYHFRLPDNQKQICQIYPYVDDKTISVEISNFDWDNDGVIRIFSIAKNGIQCDVSDEDNWKVNKFPISGEEKNSTLEVQFLKNQSIAVRNNNVVVTIRNQYGTSLPFYAVPIGGIPVYSPKIRMK